MAVARALLDSASKLAVIALALALGAVLFMTSTPVSADHQPANKFVAAGSAIDALEPGAEGVILSETMRVSTPFDLQISATVECSILTYLRTDASNVPANSQGRVELWVEIDGTPVPVQTAGYEGDSPHPKPEWDGADNGEVTFCNREYERRVLDTEGDGIDEERDFIRTRNANSFNWFALDVGRNYDKPEMGGNNVVLIELKARYTKEGETCLPSTESEQGSCSNAFVGKRTLMVEPTNASVHEQVTPGTDTDTDTD